MYNAVAHSNENGLQRATTAHDHGRSVRVGV